MKKEALLDSSLIRLFTGTAHPQLARDIAAHLAVPVSPATIRRFRDGEIEVKIGVSVRGMDVYLVQSTCPDVNQTIMELLIMIDACKRASAERITAIVPYYGYARQDRKVAARSPITAKLVANLLTTAGADRVVTVDLHAGQIQGFFDVPVDNLYAAETLITAFNACTDCTVDDIVVVSPDAGGVRRARYLAHMLDRDSDKEASLAIIDKRRTQPGHVAEVNLVGNVEGKTAVLVDDIVDSAGTLSKAADKLREEGATQVFACITHPILSPPAVENLMKKSTVNPNVDRIDALIVTDTVPLREDARACGKITVASVSGLLAQAIMNVHSRGSVSSLFPDVESYS
ncbi:MAG: ribose-phosphate pyrophosphokinase [Candidatus Lernaella stagnicola]|nr:ribose-phosphate pyrophosphokinase [Candidatus Lernaella stagnicola]